MEENITTYEDNLTIDNTQDKQCLSKVKLFQVVADNGVVKGTCKDGRSVLEQQINDFLATKDSFYINNVQFNAQRNFLPGTVLGEYQELWTALVEYEE